MAQAAQLLAVATRREGDRVVLVLDGEFDMHTAATVTGAIDEALAAAPCSVEIDTAELRFADSAALVTLLEAQQHARRVGIALYITRPSPPLERVLQMTGLHPVLTTT